MVQMFRTQRTVDASAQFTFPFYSDQNPISRDDTFHINPGTNEPPERHPEVHSDQNPVKLTGINHYNPYAHCFKS